MRVCVVNNNTRFVCHYAGDAMLHMPYIHTCAIMIMQHTRQSDAAPTTHSKRTLKSTPPYTCSAPKVVQCNLVLLHDFEN